MQAYIQKWGNSLGLRIPLQLAKQLNLHQGSAVTLEIDHDRLIIQPPKYCLDTMLSEITPKNQHHPILDDDKKGNEEW
jgi:antitoxin MazE